MAMKYKMDAANIRQNSAQYLQEPESSRSVEDLLTLFERAPQGASLCEIPPDPQHRHPVFDL
jgi:hypothetical protein